jgi:hypothetical protein
MVTVTEMVAAEPIARIKASSQRKGTRGLSLGERYMVRKLADGLWRLEPHTYAVVVSRNRWKASRHLRFIGERITDAIGDGGGRLIITLPPRHGKSELVSHYTPMWFLDNYPDKHVMLTGYSGDQALDWGRIVRNELAMNELCTTKLRDDSKAANRWHTPEGGGMVTAGVDGTITGRGGDLVIIDDPCKNWQDAVSSTIRAHEREWFGSTLYTRLEPGATIIVLMARWTDEDLAGWLEREHADPWQVIRLPAMAEADDPLGRQPGEPLWPERFDARALQNIREALMPHEWDALYQQRPTGLGTGRVHDRFDDRNVDDKVALRSDLPLQLSLDFNIRPGMHGIVGQYDSEADLFTAVWELHGPRMTVLELVDALAALIRDVGGWRWPGELHVFGDATGRSGSAAIGQSAYAILCQALARAGIKYRLRVPQANPPVIDRVNAFNMAMRDINDVVHYRVHPRCVRLISDFRRLQRSPDGLPDKHDDALSHASEAEGYRIHYLRPVQSRFRLFDRPLRISTTV